jgi:hypothetical protein
MFPRTSTLADGNRSISAMSNTARRGTFASDRAGTMRSRATGRMRAGSGGDRIVVSSPRPRFAARRALSIGATGAIGVAGSE